jgi:hypothetical protein
MQVCLQGDTRVAQNWSRLGEGKLPVNLPTSGLIRLQNTLYPIVSTAEELKNSIFPNTRYILWTTIGFVSELSLSQRYKCE